MVLAQWEAPKSSKSSRSTEVMTACESFINWMDSATWVGSSVSRGSGAAGLCVTEFARTGTDISAYHKCGCSFSPAFTHIGTTTTAADGVQFVRIYNMFCFGISCICTYAYFQPVRFFNVIHGYLFFRHGNPCLIDIYYFRFSIKKLLTRVSKW